MSLADELDFLENLGDKEAGYLIKSQDWNDLARAVITIRDTLDAHVSNTETRLSTIDGEVDQLKTSVETLDTQIEELRNRVTGIEEQVTMLAASVEPLSGYYRVTMETRRVRYAMGELAEITAKVTDLRGEELDLPTSKMPWVDFVATWGRLKPVPGFTSRGGFGDRALSVQTNGDAIAKVRLRVEHTEGLTDEEEDAVQASLQATVEESSLTIADTLLQAATPTESKAKGAYRLLSAEYERPGTAAIRTFTDAYYLRIPEWRVKPVVPWPGDTWRDYRATVTAFAKGDSDPTTPDQSRGVSSIQITFRDWIRYWICDYIRNVESIENNYLTRFTPKVTDKFEESITALQGEVKSVVRDAPVIGKQRSFTAMQSALGRLKMSVAQPPEFMDRLTQSLKNGISIQKSLEIAQHVPCGIPGVEAEQPALEAFTATSAQVATARDTLTDMQASFHQIDGKVTSLDSSIGNLNTRMNSTEATGQTIQTKLDSIEGKVLDIDITKPAELQTKLTEITTEIGGIMAELKK